MAQIGISEFTFGYAFLFEQTQANWGDLKAAPVLPSLQQEEHEGWDARLPLNGIDFYYQFKLSDYLSRGNATFIRNGTYSSPYYRIWLHQHNANQQHRRLRQHCIANPNTFYAAPQFNSLEEFNSRFLAHQITTESRIIPLALCDDIHDGDRHCITFQRGYSAWIFHSEPTKHEKSYTGRELGSLYRDSRRQWQRIDVHFAERLLEKTREIAKRVIIEEEPKRAAVVRPLLDEAQVGRERRDLLLRTADILSATLGVTLVLVGS
ncbi:MAG: hypothetical protein LAO19_17545 [Acidobacteriia bacterium]|nr:hypothetical protein [Terriglobia bacterium]